jgi:two-component system, OmpR family, response regulator
MLRAPIALAHGGGKPPRKASRQPAFSQPRTADASRRILVVDDESAMRLLFNVNLRLAGFEVVEAQNATEAIELAESRDFDLVLLDVMLPDMGGNEVARRLGESPRAGRVPIVFVSARTSREDMREGYEAGAVDYITKPFDPLELAPRIEEILARAARGESDAYRNARLAEYRE